MDFFPVIHSNGGRAQYPNAVTFEHLTNQDNLPGNAHIAFGWRAEPLARYTLNLKNLADAEVSTLETFFESMHGRFGQFAYLDPTGNLLANSDDYTQATWTKACTVCASVADPAGGTAATVLAGDGSGNSSLTQVVTIDPSVAGSLACFSVFLQAVTAGGAFNVYLTDGTTTTNAACVLTVGSWTRVSVPWTFGTSGNVTVGVGGTSCWTGTNQIAVFGPMLSMTEGAAPYLRTPGFSALRFYCRFDQDALDIEYKGINQTDVTVKIVEFVPNDDDVPIIFAQLSLVSAFAPGASTAIAFVSLWDVNQWGGINVGYLMAGAIIDRVPAWEKQTETFNLSPGSIIGVPGSASPPYGYEYGNQAYDNRSLGALLRTLMVTCYHWNSSGSSGTSHFSVYGAYLDVTLPGGVSRRYWAKAESVIPAGLVGAGPGVWGDITDPANAIDGDLATCAVLNGYGTGTWSPEMLQLFGWAE
jgi:hypothetical protein